MRKKTKIILIVIVGFIFLYSAMFITDMGRVKQLKKPIFCIESGYMGSMTKFSGLGYKIGLDISATTGEITYAQMNMLGQTVVKLYKEENESNYKLVDVKNVRADIYDISLTGATIVIKDTNKNQNTYTDWYVIEKEINGKWYQLETKVKDYGFNDMAYLPNKNSEVKFVINWEWLYGKLSPGSYRILKKVNDGSAKIISIEFGIAETS